MGCQPVHPKSPGAGGGNRGWGAVKVLAGRTFTRDALLQVIALLREEQRAQC